MESFTEFDSGLTTINEEATVIDYGNHIAIVISIEKWRDVFRSSALLSNLSMQASKPINVVTKGGERSVWMVDGMIHNPNGPCTEFHEEDVSCHRYTNKYGSQHRDDGPAVTERSSSGDYFESWLINGKSHRVGGPSVISYIASEKPNITWEQFVLKHLYTDTKRFPMSTKVRSYNSREYSWFQNGRPKNENELSTGIKDTGVYVITIITPMLVAKTFTFIKKRTYIWSNENSEYHRLNGPAEVILCNVVIEENGNSPPTFDYTSHYGRWHCNGVNLEKLTVDEWFAEKNILLKPEPPIETSAFVNEDDEFCFMTDYVSKVDPDEYGSGPF